MVIAGGVECRAGDSCTLDVGDSGLAVPFTASVEIANIGDAAAHIRSITLPTDGPFVLEGSPAVPLELGPDERVSFDVVWQPSAVGTDVGQLEVDWGAATVEIGLTATRDLVLPVITPAVCDLGAVEVGSRSGPCNIIVRNTSRFPQQCNGFIVADRREAIETFELFADISDVFGQIEPGGEVNLSLVLQPKIRGRNVADVTFGFDGQDMPDVVMVNF